MLTPTEAAVLGIGMIFFLLLWVLLVGWSFRRPYERWTKPEERGEGSPALAETPASHGGQHRVKAQPRRTE